MSDAYAPFILTVDCPALLFRVGNFHDRGGTPFYRLRSDRPIEQRRPCRRVLRFAGADPKRNPALLLSSSAAARVLAGHTAQQGGGVQSEQENIADEEKQTFVVAIFQKRFCPSRKTCWGVPSPNLTMRLAPLIPSALISKEVTAMRKNTIRLTAAV